MDNFKNFLGFLLEPWVLLATLASFAFASMNYIDEYLLSADEDKEEAPIGTLVIISGLFGIVVSYFSIIGIAINADATIWIPSELRWQSVLVGVMEIVWLVPYLIATKRSGALDTAPLFQTIPVITGILGVLFFAEVPPVVHVVGSIAIVCGAFLLNTTLETLKMDWVTIGLMLLSSTIIACINFFFKEVALESHFMATTFWGGIGMVTAACATWLLWPTYRKQFNQFVHADWGINLKVQLANETIDTIAVAASLLAIVYGPSVMTVTALNGYQPLFILLIGVVLAKAGSKVHQEQFMNGGLWKSTIAITMIAGGTICFALTSAPS